MDDPKRSPTSAPAPESLSDMVKRVAENQPDLPAMIAAGRPHLTYAGLDVLIRNTVRRLNGMGLGCGDRIALVLPDGPELAAAFVSIACGACCAPLNPAYKPAEFEFYLRDLGAQAVVVSASRDSPVKAVARDLGIALLELDSGSVDCAGAFVIRGPAGAEAAEPQLAAGADLALLLHTSGTTSRPKLVPLSHANLCASAGHIRATLRLRPQDRCLNIMPLFHIHGLIGALLSSLSAGSGVVCAPGFQSPSFLDWMEEFRPTWFTAVPTMLQAILQRAADWKAGAADSQLRFIRSSSAPLAPAVMAKLEDTFGVPVIEAYGMTEASHQMASNPLPPARRKPGSVGLPSGPEIAVLDESGKPAPANQAGEIVIRGPNVTAGYENNPGANEEAFRHGWFRTGDLGYMDGDGYLFLTGRAKEMINRGSEKISPREVEERLLEHPAVAQAVAFAMPDARLGEEVAAAVVLAPRARAAEPELREFVHRRLADFKVPRRIVFLDEIPKGPTGKLQRIGLAERLGISGIRYEQDKAGQFVEPGTGTEKKLAAMISELLRIPRVGLRDNFFLLGGDSMMTVQLIAQIEQEFERAITVLDLLAGPTVEGMSHLIEGHRQPDSDSATLSIQPNGSRPPLFCTPTIDGTLLPFANLAGYLGEQQPIIGLRQPPLRDRTELLSIEEQAAIHLGALRAARPEGPYYLMGLCFGGLVAYEMARRLTHEGERVALLIMADCINHDWKRSAHSFRVGWSSLRLLLRRIGYAAGTLAPRSFRTIPQFLKTKLVLFRLAWGHRIRRLNYERRRRAGKPVARLIRDVNFHNYLASRRYVPGPYAGKIILVRSEAPREGEPGEPLLGWENLAAGGAELVTIRGDHYSMMSEPNIKELAAALKDRLQEN